MPTRNWVAAPVISALLTVGTWIVRPPIRVIVLKIRRAPWRVARGTGAVRRGGTTVARGAHLPGDGGVGSPAQEAATGPSGKLTLSIGISTFPEDGTEPDELIDRADKALYRAKREGRNKAFVWEAEKDEPQEALTAD